MSFSNQPINVFLVAPVLLCWGFEKLVQTCPPIRMSGSAPSLAQGAYIREDVLVDVLVVDHDEAYGAEALTRAARLFPVLLLTSGHAASTLEQVRGMGVMAAVRKRDAASLLLNAIEAISPGQDRGQRRWRSHSSPGHYADAARTETDQERIESLTARELQVISALTTNAMAPGKVIASDLRISEHTLRNHLTSIYAKLGVSNRLSLHAYAADHRLDQQHGPCASGARGRSRTGTDPEGKMGRSSHGIANAQAVGFRRTAGITSSLIERVPAYGLE